LKSRPYSMWDTRMMEARITGSMLVLLAAGGCGPNHYWYKNGGTLEQARNDYCDCKFEAQEEATQAVADKYGKRLQGPVLPPAFYVLPSDDDSVLDDPTRAVSAWGETYERNVFMGCMKRKGYQDLSVRRLPPGTHTKGLSMGNIAGQ